MNLLRTNGFRIPTPDNMQKTTVICLLFLTCLFACKKNQLDGDATIRGRVYHHEKPIPNASVFIKFNAKNFPSQDTNVYDAKVRADKDGYFSFKCYKGSYYLYSFGFDYGIPSPYHVLGGLPIRVRTKETVEIDLAVTED